MEFVVRIAMPGVPGDGTQSFVESGIFRQEREIWRRCGVDEADGLQVLPHPRIRAKALEKRGALCRGMLNSRENESTEDRVHLVMDCVVDDWLRGVFDGVEPR